MLKNPFSGLKNDFFLTLTLFSIFIGFYFSFYTLIHGGIGWDSPGDMISAQAFLNLSGKESLNQAYELIPATSEFYGFFIYQLTDFILKIFFNIKFDFNYQNFLNFQLISITNFLLSLFAIFFMGIVLFFITRSKIIALGFIALMQTNPIWVGMQIVNFKDTPVAAGLTFLSAALLLLLNIKNKKFLYNISGVFFAIFGLIICLNSRAGSIVLALIIYLFFNILYFLNYVLKDRFKILDLFLINLVILPITFIITYILNPFLRINSFQWLFDSIKVSRNFPAIQPVRAAGVELMSNNLPWWYIPSWIFAQSPIVILILIIIIFYLFLKKFNHYILNFNVLLLSVQSILIPLLFIVFNLNLYNAIRHILFYLPALYALLILLLFYFKQSISKSYLIKVLIFLIPVLNLIETYRWIPYSYSYINQIAGISSDKRNWDLDYWGVSSREGISNLMKLTQLRPIYVLPDSGSSLPFFGVKKPNENVNTPFSMYVFMHWNHKLLPSKCEIIFEIKRDNQILGMGGKCFEN